VTRLASLAELAVLAERGGTVVESPEAKRVIRAVVVMRFEARLVHNMLQRGLYVKEWGE